ncbi:MAG: galactose mutarotase [Bacteroidales bacterium]|nr:galactose mutarotase [Bacteroidales bacterium]
MKRISRIFLPGVIILILASCQNNSNVKVNVSFNEHKEADSQNIVSMKTAFGTVDHKPVFLYTLTNTNGLTVKITNYGGIITSILMPDKYGKPGDIVLGYDGLKDYIANSPYFGALVGRYANRIAKGRFILDGKTYKLAINNGNNALHGGLKGFDKVVWDVSELKDSTRAGLILTYVSKDGEEGYPGNLKIKAIYTLNENDELILQIEATTDKPTPVNICNHTYFNLSEADTNILGHIVTLYADQFTEVNGELIPTGKLPSVRGTPMDFITSVAIGAGIDKVRGGYDHNYVLRKKPGELALATQVFDPRTGRQVEILTTQPGIQFYTGNFLDGTIRGKGGKIYKKHYGFCLETQHFPDSPNQPNFPTTILMPGKTYSETTIYKFSVLK